MENVIFKLVGNPAEFKGKHKNRYVTSTGDVHVFELEDGTDLKIPEQWLESIHSVDDNGNVCGLKSN